MISYLEKFIKPLVLSVVAVAIISGGMYASAQTIRSVTQVTDSIVKPTVKPTVKSAFSLKSEKIKSAVIVVADSHATITPKVSLGKNLYTVTVAAKEKTVGILPINPRGVQSFIDSKQLDKLWLAKANGFEQDPPDAILWYQLNGQTHHEVVKLVGFKVVGTKLEPQLEFHVQKVAGVGGNFTKEVVVSPVGLFIDNCTPPDCGGLYG